MICIACLLLIIIGVTTDINATKKYNTKKYKKNVKTIEDFAVPQLNKTKQVWIYLPPDYKKTNKSYPVLYMQDGDQLFNTDARRGGWQVDKTLNQLFEENKTTGVIVVGIESADGDQRSREYNLLPLTGLVENPQGSRYLDFLVNDLKPYIDNNYRTLADRDNTGIMGSSFGGTISLAAGFKYPNLFSKVGALSSGISPLFFRDKIYFEKKLPMKIYFDCGTKEDFCSENKDDYQLLREIGFTKEELKLVIEKGGRHNNNYWRKRFPAVFLWLFEGQSKFEKYISKVNIY